MQYHIPPMERLPAILGYWSDWVPSLRPCLWLVPSLCLIGNVLTLLNVGVTCLWYTGGSCTGTQSDYVNYPGWSTVPGFWQFNTASYKCWN